MITSPTYTARKEVHRWVIWVIWSNSIRRWGRMSQYNWASLPGGERAKNQKPKQAHRVSYLTFFISLLLSVTHQILLQYHVQPPSTPSMWKDRGFHITKPISKCHMSIHSMLLQSGASKYVEKSTWSKQDPKLSNQWYEEPIIRTSNLQPPFFHYICIFPHNIIILLSQGLALRLRKPWLS